MLAWSNLMMLWRDAEFQTLLILGEFDLDATHCRRARSLGKTSVPGSTSTRHSGNKQKLREVDCSHVDLTSCYLLLYRKLMLRPISSSTFAVSPRNAYRGQSLH